MEADSCVKHFGVNKYKGKGEMHLRLLHNFSSMGGGGVRCTLFLIYMVPLDLLGYYGSIFPMCIPF